MCLPCIGDGWVGRGRPMCLPCIGDGEGWRKDYSLENFWKRRYPQGHKVCVLTRIVLTSPAADFRGVGQNLFADRLAVLPGDFGLWVFDIVDRCTRQGRLLEDSVAANAPLEEG